MLLDDPGKTRHWHIKVGRHIMTPVLLGDLLVSPTCRTWVTWDYNQIC